MIRMGQKKSKYSTNDDHIKSWSCEGCTNVCYMLYESDVRKYCRVNFDYPDNKGLQWQENYLACLDYTTDPKAEDKQIRIWSEAKYKQKMSEL